MKESRIFIHTVHPEQYDNLVKKLRKQGYLFQYLIDWSYFKGRTVVALDIVNKLVLYVTSIEAVENPIYYNEEALWIL